MRIEVIQSCFTRCVVVIFYEFAHCGSLGVARMTIAVAGRADEYESDAYVGRARGLARSSAVELHNGLCQGL